MSRHECFIWKSPCAVSLGILPVHAPIGFYFRNASNPSHASEPVKQLVLGTRALFALILGGVPLFQTAWARIRNRRSVWNVGQPPSAVVPVTVFRTDRRGCLSYIFSAAQLSFAHHCPSHSEAVSRDLYASSGLLHQTLSSYQESSARPCAGRGCPPEADKPADAGMTEIMAGDARLTPATRAGATD
jgi:hypothetical protein